MTRLCWNPAALLASAKVLQVPKTARTVCVTSLHSVTSTPNLILTINKSSIGEVAIGSGLDRLPVRRPPHIQGMFLTSLFVPR